MGSRNILLWCKLIVRLNNYCRAILSERDYFTRKNYMIVAVVGFAELIWHAISGSEHFLYFVRGVGLIQKYHIRSYSNVKYQIS